MSDCEDKYVLSIDEIPQHDNRFKDIEWEGNVSLYPRTRIPINPKYQIHIGDTLTDAKRYRWLKEHVFEVLCEGKGDCYSKYMLPRLVAEDSTGRKFTFDEIIDIQMKRSGE